MDELLDSLTVEDADEGDEFEKGVGDEALEITAQIAVGDDDPAKNGGLDTWLEITVWEAEESPHLLGMPRRARAGLESRLVETLGDLPEGQALLAEATSKARCSAFPEVDDEVPVLVAGVAEGDAPDTEAPRPSDPRVRPSVRAGIRSRSCSETASRTRLMNLAPGASSLLASAAMSRAPSRRTSRSTSDQDLYGTSQPVPLSDHDGAGVERVEALEGLHEARTDLPARRRRRCPCPRTRRRPRCRGSWPTRRPFCAGRRGSAPVVGSMRAGRGPRAWGRGSGAWRRCSRGSWWGPSSRAVRHKPRSP